MERLGASQRAGPDGQWEGAERCHGALCTPLLLAEYEELSHTEIGALPACSAQAVEIRI